jgi:KAP family P-loop domain
MRFLPLDDEVKLYETVFADDLLGRVAVGKLLSSVIERIEDPLVIALDGKWGTGKSYFLRRWVGAHRLSNEGKALTVYFDAFANDYLSDPLTSLVAALSNRIPRSDQSKFSKVKKAATKLIRPAARVGLAVASAGGTVLLDEVWDAGVDALKGEAKNALDEFWKRETGRHAAMEEFRSSIQSLTQSEDGQQTVPLVVVIDELDRCRPDFALEVLEVIKHFFAVPRVHFVLGVNLHSLENSVKARYGSGIDAAAYLQKFVSFSMSLPDHIGDNLRTSVIAKYAAHLGEKMKLPSKFSTEIREQLAILSRENAISVRDVGKIMSMSSLLPDQATADNILDGWRIATVTLLITRVIRPELASKLTFATATPNELVGYFGATRKLISETLEDGKRNPDYVHRVMILYYCWMYICRNGVSDGSENWTHLGRLFDDFGRVHSVNTIPRHINDDWLSIFRLS